VEITDRLGVGRTATVYRVKFNSKEVVLKRFRTSTFAASELAALQRVKVLNQTPNRTFVVPELVVNKVSDCRLCLIVTPIGLPFALSPRHRAAAASATASAPASAAASASASAIAPTASALPSTAASDRIRVLPRACHMSAVVDVLQQLHPMGLCHRDISPTNCFALPPNVSRAGVVVSATCDVPAPLLC
jgi:serine/threonine protein kinase